MRVQAERSSAFLDRLMPDRFVFASGEGGVLTTDATSEPVIIRAGDGLPDTDWAELHRLVKLAVAKPDTPHQSVTIAQLEASDDGLAFLQAARSLLMPFMVDGGYRVVDMFVKTTFNNSNPWHQDKQTGKDCFERGYHVLADYGEGAMPAIRLLVNLGTWESADGYRPMGYRLKGGGGVLVETQARWVGMNGPAAGSAFCSNIEHARLADGVTLCLDVMLPLMANRRGGFALSVEDIPTKVRRWFQPYQDVNPAFWATAGLDVSLLDDEAQRRAGDSATEASPEPHCRRCGAREGTMKPVRNNKRVGEEHQGIALCRECWSSYIALHRNRKFKQRMRATVSPSFGLFARCPDTCTGCRPTLLDATGKGHRAAVASLAARPTAVDGVEERWAAVPEDLRLVAREEPHCWWCGGERDPAIVRAHTVGAVDALVCRSCHWVIKEQLMEDRVAQCPPACSGCKRLVGVPNFAAATEQRWREAAIPEALQDQPREEPHCWLCGTSDAAAVSATERHLSSTKLRQVGGPRAPIRVVLMCAPCQSRYNIWKKKRPAPPLAQRPNRCPEACPGCNPQKQK